MTLDRAPAADSPSRSLRVLFVLRQGEPAPGPRYRVLQFLPAYRRAGVDADVVAVLGEAATRRALRSVHLSPLARVMHLALAWFESQVFMRRLPALSRRYDRVYLYRVPLSRRVARQLAGQRDRLIYDFDDALDAGEGTTLLAGLRRRVWRGGLRCAVACCRTIVTSNERNAQVIRDLGGHAVVVPTCVDVERYPVRRHDTANTPVVLGWIGTPSTSRYLSLIHEPLARVAAARSIEIRLIGAGTNPFPDLPVTILPWDVQTEAAQVASFDVGLMPMPDTAWTNGKAALKALQYGAAGVPTVASWTATNEQILGLDRGSVLCRNAADWESALLSVVDDPTRRAAMGDVARQDVEARYSIAANVPVLLNVLRT